MYITDIFLKTLLSIHFNFFPIFSQNLSSQTWGEAYTPVFTVFISFLFIRLQKNCTVTIYSAGKM